MNNINKLNVYPYCYKVLPLVYDDSLSYYEVLCKLTGKMNELIENINDSFGNINDNIGNEIDEYLSLHFNELMVQAAYNEEEKCIYFTRNTIKIGDHTYLADSETMKLED